MATRQSLGNMDHWFTGDRKDPYSHKIFDVGDVIVVCGNCKSPHLEDTWGQNPNRPCSVCEGNGMLLEFEEFNDSLFQLVDTGNGVLRPARHFDPEAQAESHQHRETVWRIREGNRQRVELLREIRLRKAAKRYLQITNRAAKWRQRAETRLAQMLEAKMQRESRRKEEGLLRQTEEWRVLSWQYGKR